MVTITFSVSMVNLKNITDETTDFLRFCDLKKKKKEFLFLCHRGGIRLSHSLGRRVCGHRHGHLGNLDRALDAALGCPVNTGCVVCMFVQAVRVPHAVIERLSGAFTRGEHAPESMSQVLAPQGVDDGVHGGIQQAQHTAERKHRLNKLVHLPKDIVHHDGK